MSNLHYIGKKLHGHVHIQNKKNELQKTVCHVFLWISGQYKCLKNIFKFARLIFCHVNINFNI